MNRCLRVPYDSPTSRCDGSEHLPGLSVPGSPREIPPFEALSTARRFRSVRRDKDRGHKHTLRAVNEDSENPIERIVRLRDEARAHPGAAPAGTIRRLNDPYRLLLWPNARELDQHLDLFSRHETALPLMDIRYRERLDKYLEEVLRLVHNLVAAVGTTIDHNRRTLRKAYPQESLHPVWCAFRTSIEPFQQDGELRFVQDLRDFVLHRALPDAVANMHWNRDSGTDYSIRFNSVTLLEWDRWSASTRAFIEQSGESLTFRPSVQRYIAATNTVRRSLTRAIEAHHKEDLRGWRAIASEHDHVVEEQRLKAFPELLVLPVELEDDEAEDLGGQ